MHKLNFENKSRVEWDIFAFVLNITFLKQNNLKQGQI